MRGECRKQDFLKSVLVDRIAVGKHRIAGDLARHPVGCRLFTFVAVEIEPDDFRFADRRRGHETMRSPVFTRRNARALAGGRSGGEHGDRAKPFKPARGSSPAGVMVEN